MLWLLTSLAIAGSSGAMTVGFEPRVLTITGSDDALEDYGFAPVRSPFLPTWGLRGRIDADTGWTTTFRYARTNPVPTTTSQVLLGFGPGHTVGPRGHLGAVFGFGSLGHTVGSTRQGGALTYLGPYLEPRASYRAIDGPAVLELSVAALAHLPVGPAHRQAFWEEDFRRPLIGGLSIGLHAGPTVGR